MSATEIAPVIEAIGSVNISATSAKPQLMRLDAHDPSTTSDLVSEVIRRDGGVIIENLITSNLALQMKSELKPYFDTDRIDPTGFFPVTTKRASGLIGISPGCVDYLTTPLLIDVANNLLSSTYTFWLGKKQRTVHTKAQISSTTAFRVNPGGAPQELHRDDAYVVYVTIRVMPS